ncbi:MAG: VOC family protein [Chloroflexi bacterium]|nr:VOC family protein [Chloroflexota bacterium]
MQLRWAIVYVRDVEASVAFYERAFGVGLRFVAPGGEYAELETGDTALGLAANSMAATNFAEPIRENDPALPPAAFEIGFEVEDVAGAYAHAVEAGATPLAEPVEKPWGQTVAYVRDPDGILVELGSPTGGEA